MGPSNHREEEHGDFVHPDDATRDDARSGAGHHQGRHRRRASGGISHAVIVDGGQVTIFDVWESEEAMNTFTSERLVPAIQKQMAAMGMDPKSPPPMPEVRVFEAYDAMGA
jgi:hypothetical protein